METLAYFAIGLVVAVALFLWGMKQLEGDNLFRLCAVCVCCVFIWPLVLLSMLVGLFIYLATAEEDDTSRN